LDTFKLFLVVSLTVSSHRSNVNKFQLAINFKDKNGAFVPSTPFSGFF